jgi:hypothetical protein
MPSLILTLGLLLGVLIAPAGLAAAAPATAVVASVDAYQDQQPSAKIDVDINRGGGGAWYTSPVWLAIGGLALVVLVLLVVSATRGGGGGTTVVRG